MRLKFIGKRKVKSGEPLVITCVFGGHFKTLHQAPSGFTTIVFSNNPVLKPEAVKMGWNLDWFVPEAWS